MIALSEPTPPEFSGLTTFSVPCGWRTADQREVGRVPCVKLAPELHTYYLPFAQMASSPLKRKRPLSPKPCTPVPVLPGEQTQKQKIGT